MKKRSSKTAAQGGHLPANPPATLATRTRFGQFMELLTRRRFKPKAALDGSPVGYWHGFPVEEAVTNGLMLVILDFAKKEDRAVATSDDVVSIARRLDALVNAGLSVCYPNAEAASESFVKKVVEPVHRAARLGFRPDAPPPMALWKEIVGGKPVPPPLPRAAQPDAFAGDIGPFLGRPAALFFVRIINGALRHRARLQVRLADLERSNRVGGPVTWIPDADLEFARSVIRSLGVRVGAAILSKGSESASAPRLSKAWGGWLEIGAAFDACRDRIAVLKKWPVRIQSIPEGMQPTSVQEGWIETIALMAIGRQKSESDTLSPAGFWKAVSMHGETCRGEKGGRPLRLRLLKSLKSRDAALPAEVLASLSDLIDASLEKVGNAFDAYEQMVSEMESVEREMVGLKVAIRKLDARLATVKKGKEAIHEARDSAADRLSRLQELHDCAKNEFRSTHFPAIFLPDTAAEEALMGGR